MIVLGIESTCDETAAAIVKDGNKILSNIIASSAELHAKYGGVFPEVACRKHIESIIPVIQEAIAKAEITHDMIDLISVAKGPGLVGALLIGMNVAKGLSIAWNKPFIGVNHVEAHLYAAMMDQEDLEFPALGLVLSGGHTLILKIEDVGIYKLIGTTVDDAVGEAFDKVGSLLSLPYPGGPHIERLAQNGNPHALEFSAGNVKKNPFDFSFSGLKTAVLYAVKNKILSDEQKCDVAASFQETAFQDILKKAKKAASTFDCKSIFLGGGVCNNQRLRNLFCQNFQKVHFPPKNLSLDNAVMIAGLGAKKYKGVSDPLNLEVQTRIPITNLA